MHFDQGIWIIGGGGIGSALADKCRKDNIQTQVIKRPDYDMTQPEDVTRFLETVNTLPSVIVNTIGILYDEIHKPEKSITTFNADWFYESIRVNTLPVIWLAQALAKKLSKNDTLRFITLSARISSISDNHLGGWHSYRASKCALNMLIKNISIEWSRRFPNVSICGYHPGTVDTHLSAPFKSNVKPEKLFSPEKAANCLFDQITRTTPEMSGNLFDWQGKQIVF